MAQVRSLVIDLFEAPKGISNKHWCFRLHSNTRTEHMYSIIVAYVYVHAEEATV